MIMQPQALLVPIDMAPNQLPPSVSQFLSHSLDIPLDYTCEYWTILKDIIWDYPAADDVKQVDKDAFRIHRKKCGLNEYLYHHTNTEWQVTSVLLQQQGPSTPINATVQTQSVFVQHKSYL